MKSKFLIGVLACASLFAAGLFMNHSVSASPPSSPMPSRQPSGYEVSLGSPHSAYNPSYEISASLEPDGELFVNIMRPGRLRFNDRYYLNEAMKQLPSWIDELVKHVTVTFFSPFEYEYEDSRIEYMVFSLPVQDVLQILS